MMILIRIADLLKVYNCSFDKLYENWILYCFLLLLAIVRSKIKKV